MQILFDGALVLQKKTKTNFLHLTNLKAYQPKIWCLKVTCGANFVCVLNSNKMNVQTESGDIITLHTVDDYAKQVKQEQSDFSIITSVFGEI